MKTIPTPRPACGRFADDNWPLTGPIWVEMDNGGHPIGWRLSPFVGTRIGAARAEGEIAAREWAAAQVGDVVAVPARYHPRHGVKWDYWTRVR